MRAAIVAHARAEAPNECCGLLLGRGMGVEESVPVRNIDPDPRVRYLIDPGEHVAVIRRARGAEQSILGCYHSHPHSAPRPSETDVACAYYTEFVWIIVALPPRGGARVRAWRIVDGRTVPVRVVAS